MQQTKIQVWSKEHPMMSGILGLLLIGIVMAALVSAFSDPSQPLKDAGSSAVSTQKVVFDVPSLLGKDVDQIKKELGTPIDDVELTELQLKNLDQAAEWSKTFEKDGVKLLVTYSSRTRKVIDFFISDLGDQNKTRIMAAGGLKNDDPAYRLEFVKALTNPAEYTGLKITPIVK